eukprot:165416_1
MLVILHSFDLNKLNAHEMQQIEALIDGVQKESRLRQIMTQKSQSVSVYINSPNDCDTKPDDKENAINRFAALVGTDNSTSALFLAACDWIVTAAVDCFYVCNGKVEILRQKIAE